jgi:ABC-2 type transport system permease protein
MNKIKTIIRKEWAQVFKNRLVLFSVAFMPLLFTAIPLFMLFSMREGGGESQDLTSDLPSQFSQFCKEGLSPIECFQVYTINQFMLLFMMTPLIIPVNIAAYSVVGEKTTHSLEPLLATPITTMELLVGKNLAAALPAIIATWIYFIIYVVGAWLIVQSPHVVSALLDPMWWIAVVVTGPLLAILSVNFALMVSSRVNEPRVAEQLSAVVILPLLALFIGQVAGIFLINRTLVLLFSLIVLILDVILVNLAGRLFQRETILTQWK